jgi:hypothetical protein
MAETREERLKKLAGRFKSHASGQPAAAPSRARDRLSLYVDRDLMRRVDRTYRDVNHQLYPSGGLTKSAFLEALIEYSLQHLPDVKQALADGVKKEPQG